MRSSMEQQSPSAHMKALIAQARLFTLPNSLSLSNEHVQYLLEADQAKRLLHGEELQALCSESQADQEDILNFQRLMPSLVEHAKSTLHGQFPQLFTIGGSLHTPDRSKACWRDLWHFLRIASYGAAIGEAGFCDQQGYAATMELYRLLDVPVDAMASALLDMASTYRAQLQPSAISATQQLLLLGLAGIHSALEESHHLSWSTTG